MSVRETIDIEVVIDGLDIGETSAISGQSVTVELDNGVTIGVIPGLHYLALSEEQYDALEMIDENMFYFIYEDE